VYSLCDPLPQGSSWRNEKRCGKSQTDRKILTGSRICEARGSGKAKAWGKDADAQCCKAGNGSLETTECAPGDQSQGPVITFPMRPGNNQYEIRSAENEKERSAGGRTGSLDTRTAEPSQDWKAVKEDCLNNGGEWGG